MVGGFCDFRAQPAPAAMVMGWLWGRPEQLDFIGQLNFMFRNQK